MNRPEYQELRLDDGSVIRYGYAGVEHPADPNVDLFFLYVGNVIWLVEEEWLQPNIIKLFSESEKPYGYGSRMDDTSWHRIAWGFQMWFEDDRGDVFSDPSWRNYFQFSPPVPPQSRGDFLLNFACST